jgi:hypothetical protein
LEETKRDHGGGYSGFIWASDPRGARCGQITVAPAPAVVFLVETATSRLPPLSTFYLVNASYTGFTVLVGLTALPQTVH